MKKRSIVSLFTLAIPMMVLTSCFTYTYNVGSGPQTGVKTEQKNQYLIFGLAPMKVSDPTVMAGGATNYSVTIQHTFVDGLLQAITFGIYTPTTTTITK